jgi:SecD/SecF fusion protein
MRGIVVVVAMATLAAAGCGSSRTRTVKVGAAGRTGASNVSIPAGNRVVLVYRAYAGAEPVTPASLDAAIRIMRKRLAEANVSSAIERSGPRNITVILPRVGTTPSAEPIVGKTAQLFFYDWEPNVIGADGKPAPTEQTVTGGANAGASQFGLPEYQAVLRAAKRAPELRKTDTTWSKGCTPAQVGGCIYGDWYLLEAKHEKVLRGPEETEKNLTSEKLPKGTGAVKAVRVNPGTVLVQARPIESAGGKVTQKSPNSWFVMVDKPVLTGADVKNPRQAFDEGAGGTGAPNVTFEFTGHGQSVFQQTTKEIAHRGQEAQLPGVPKEAAQQHFAVVLDGQLITTPSIDYTKYPEGIDATTGSQISGGFTITSAQELAQELQSGALPIKLQLISREAGSTR